MRQILFAITLVLATSFLANAQMTIAKSESNTTIVNQPPLRQVTKKITSYNVTLLGSASGKLRGWIELRDGSDYAGYIYLTDEDPLPKDYLGGSDYVVMHQRSTTLENLLSILRNEKNLQIRFSDNSQPPLTFLEKAGSTNIDKPLLSK
ncbi:MAG: hypothetical protein WAU45_00520 [Blastocatellia bacterium]